MAAKAIYFYERKGDPACRESGGEPLPRVRPDAVDTLRFRQDAPVTLSSLLSSPERAAVVRGHGPRTLVLLTAGNHPSKLLPARTGRSHPREPHGSR